MPLIKCPDCGKQVSDKAEACPSCGYPFEKLRKEKMLNKQAEEDLRLIKERQKKEELDKQNRTCTDCAYYCKEYDEEICTYYNKSFNFMSKSKAKSCKGYYYSQQSHDRYSNKCYLTTACCEYYGKDDDCEELTTLRAFRDGFLMQTEDGKALVEEYYETAPAIVQALKQANDSQSFEYIYSVVQKCVEYVKNENYNDALAAYKRMVLELKNKLN